ncbi:hypothetical protein J132_02394 [Termitomyces sp. J132]|nr:hypothetical protein J132_02394 [Termitomyces sp. J132]
MLTLLTKKECNKNFPTWMHKQQEAFNAICYIVTDLETLIVIDYEDPSKKIFVTTDASDHRMGTILSFGKTWESAHPVAYDLYQLNMA